MIFLKIVLFIASLNNFAFANTSQSELQNTLRLEQDGLVRREEEARLIKASLFEINARMKKMSQKREQIMNKILNVERNVEHLEKSKNEIQDTIVQDRALLSKRLRAIYKMGQEGTVRAIFSSTSSYELDRTLRFLKKISDKDYKLIKSHEKNLLSLRKRQKKLEKELKSLAILRSSLKKQEDDLEAEQRSKSEIVRKFAEENNKSLKKIASVRQVAKLNHVDSEFRITFFEKKGQLKPPAPGQLLRGFGLMENSDFHYRLSHKGHLYSTPPGSEVRSIADSAVSFVGKLEGYGDVIILDHGDHFYSLYTNVARVLVALGDRISEGHKIAITASELYFEMRHFSEAIDPAKWLAQQRSNK